MNKLVLQEDDCAPDAREHFSRGMKERFDLDFNTFFETGIKVHSHDLRIQRFYKNYILEYNGDDPYYRLYQRR